jgi:hypothetical protein
VVGRPPDTPDAVAPGSVAPMAGYITSYFCASYGLHCAAMHTLRDFVSLARVISSRQCAVRGIQFHF